MEGSTKAEKLKNMVLKKKKCDTKAMEIVTRLIETNVELDFLVEKAGRIRRQQWDDIVEERRIIGICGWVLCNERLQTPPTQKYIIRKNRVLDIRDRKSYCSSVCYGCSEHFKQQIPDSPLWLRDEEPNPTFTIIDSRSKADVSLDGITVKLGGIEIDSSDSVLGVETNDEFDS